MMEGEKKMEKMMKDKEYRLRREVMFLRKKVEKSESDEEDRERRMFNMHRQKEVEDGMRKRVRIEEEEREKVREEIRRKTQTDVKLVLCRRLVSDQQNLRSSIP